MEDKTIEVRARVSLGDFCFTECKAYCCRKGYVEFTPEEYVLIFKVEEKDKPKDKLTVYLGDRCPALNSDFKCSIHSNKLHPKVCGDYPIFVKGNHVILAGNCLAVKEDKFYPFLKEWIANGFEVVIGSGVDGFKTK